MAKDAPDFRQSSVCVVNGGGGTSKLVRSFRNDTYAVTSFDSRCDNASATTHTLQPNETQTVECASASSFIVDFRKSWRQGCPTLMQTYLVVQPLSHFIETPCGVELKSLPPGYTSNQCAFDVDTSDAVACGRPDASGYQWFCSPKNHWCPVPRRY